MRDPFATLKKAPLHYPEIFRVWLPKTNAYVINQPELAQHVLQKNAKNYPKDTFYEYLALLFGKGLITNEGEDWRKQRILMQPAFHRKSLEKISKIVVEATLEMLKRWKTLEGESISFTREISRLTIDIVTRSMFSADVSHEQVRMFAHNLNYLNDTVDQLATQPFSLPWKVPTPRYQKSRRYIQEMDGLINGIIHNRKEKSNSSGDLLQLLLDARYEESGQAMTDKQIRDEVMTVFAAGHETTVNALTYTWFLLQKHPEELEKLKQESLPMAKFREPQFSDLPKLEFGLQVINESMRLYPPVVIVSRKALQEDQIGEYYIPTEKTVLINIAGMHHHPEYWENPTQFHPDRFANFDLKGTNRFLFLPFGGGPRICIGNNFAMMEMQLINALLASRVEMELISQEIHPEPKVTLKPREDLMIQLKKIKTVPTAQPSGNGYS